MGQAAYGWRLRPADLDDVDDLHALASRPLVFRYLFDGAAPDRECIVGRIAQSIANAPVDGFGMWMLESFSARYAGCVELRPYPAPRSAELTYLLDPRHWGQGLAVRMAWTVIVAAFRSSRIDTIVAGADQPNAASFAVMGRLGMRYHKDVQYPLGAGVEYVLHCDDAGPMPRPALLRMR
jgi:[ribosomal protein S5]-alanine N-acetyltransferase